MAFIVLIDNNDKITHHDKNVAETGFIILIDNNSNNLHHDTKNDSEKPRSRSDEAKDTKMTDDRDILQAWYLSIQARPSESVGYQYPGCTTQMLDQLNHCHHTFARARKRIPICSDQAAQELKITLLTPPTEAQQECIARLKVAWTDPNWSSDIAMKSFFDLDAVYFAGRLRKKCRLYWKEYQEFLKYEAAFCHKVICYGVTQSAWVETKHRVDIPSAMIWLNAEACLKNAKSLEEAKRDTFGTLLHEMIHGNFPLHTETSVSGPNELTAYDWVECIGHPRMDWMADREIGHGPNFEIAATALSVRTRKDLGFKVLWTKRKGLVKLMADGLVERR